MSSGTQHYRKKIPGSVLGDMARTEPGTSSLLLWKAALKSVDATDTLSPTHLKSYLVKVMNYSTGGVRRPGQGGAWSAPPQAESNLLERARRSI